MESNYQVMAGNQVQAFRQWELKEKRLRRKDADNRRQRQEQTAVWYWPEHFYSKKPAHSYTSSRVPFSLPSKSVRAEVAGVTVLKDFWMRGEFIGDVSSRVHQTITVNSLFQTENQQPKQLVQVP